MTHCLCRDHVSRSKEHHLCNPSAEVRQKALRQVLELPAPKLPSLGLKTTRTEKITRVETHVSVHPGMRTVDEWLFNLVENMSKCYFT